MKEKHRCGAEGGTKVVWLGFYRIISLSFYLLDEQQKKKKGIILKCYVRRTLEYFIIRDFGVFNLL